MSTRFVFAALALCTLACETTRSETRGDGTHCCRGPVIYPPYKGPLPEPLKPGSKLPADPGPGLLYVRIIYSTTTGEAFAYLVHAADTGTRLLGIVGPLKYTDDDKLNDYPRFFHALCEAYSKHGPGLGSCCPTPPGAAGAPLGGKALTPKPPPAPPPPSAASAVVVTSQDGAVVPSDPQLAGNATGAAGAAFPVLNGF